MRLYAFIFFVFGLLTLAAVFFMPVESFSATLHGVVLEECQRKGFSKKQCLGQYEPELVKHIQKNLRKLKKPCGYSEEFYPVHRNICEAVLARVEDWGY